MRKINWLVLLPALLFIGLGYLLGISLTQAGGKINHLMLVTSGVSISFCYLSMTTLGGGFHRELPWWKAILSTLGVIAAFWFFLGGALGIIGAGLGTFDPGLYARFRTMWITSLLAMGYWIFCLATIWIHYQVAEETVVVLDGRVLYPGAKFTLYPWFRYKVRTLNRWVRIPSTKMELNFTDGRFKMVVRPSSVGLAISTAQETGVKSLDYKAFIATVKRWVLECLRDQARTQTLGAFLNREPSREHANIYGIPISWDGEAKVTLLQ